MGTTILGADVIDKGQDIIGVAVVVLESYLDLETTLLALEIENRSQGFLVFIEIADKVFNPILIVVTLVPDLDLGAVPIFLSVVTGFPPFSKRCL